MENRLAMNADQVKGSSRKGRSSGVQISADQFFDHRRVKIAKIPRESRKLARGHWRLFRRRAQASSDTSQRFGNVANQFSANLQSAAVNANHRGVDAVYAGAGHHAD